MYAEIVTSVPVVPDAIGWGPLWRSELVEVKVSRSTSGTAGKSRTNAGTYLAVCGGTSLRLAFCVPRSCRTGGAWSRLAGPACAWCGRPWRAS